MSEKIQVGQIGFGTHGSQFFFPAFRASELAQVVAVTDINSLARKRAEDFGLPTYASVDEMLARHDDIRYLAVAVPHTQALPAINQLAESATKLKLNVAVTTEKPMATTLKEAVEVAEILKTVFSFGAVFNRFSYPPFQFGLEQITAGVIGKITRLHDEITISGLPPLLDPWVHLPDRNDQTLTRGNALLNGFHAATIIALLTGLPESVSATVEKQGLYPGTEVDDTVNLNGFSLSGQVLSYHCGWGAIPNIVVATHALGENGQIIIEQWGKVHKNIGNEPWHTQEFPVEKEFAAKHDAGVRLYHETILRWLLDNNSGLPHTIEHAVKLGVVSQAIVEMSYLSSARNEAVTPEEVVDGIMPLSELQTMAALAQLPQLRST